MLNKLIYFNSKHSISLRLARKDSKGNLHDVKLKEVIYYYIL